MKKLSILIAFLLFGAGLRAQQTNLTQAVDFTVTDCHGQTYNLFEILDRAPRWSSSCLTEAFQSRDFCNSIHSQRRMLSTPCNKTAYIPMTAQER